MFWLGQDRRKGYTFGMTTTQTKKKLFLINRDFQMRFAGAGVVASLVTSVMTAALIIYPLFAFKILTSVYFLPWPVVAGVILAILLNMILQLVFGIMLTHRVAGAMFSMIRTIRLIGSGKWSAQVKLRHHDELQMMGRHLNEMSEQLVRDGKHDLAVVEQVMSMVEKLEANPVEKKAAQQSLEGLALRLRSRINPHGNKEELS